MKQIGLLLLVAALSLAAGCSGSGSEPESSSTGEAETDDQVTRAAEIMKAIEADPDAADEILQSHDMTVEQFEQVMYEISADPALSKAYEAALAN